MLKIGGIKYKIVLKDTENSCGQLNQRDNEIIINSTLSPEQKQITLLHEIIHAVNGELNEVVVDSLAQQLHQVLTENKLWEAIK
jgi:Zn-dependent peptidase ImmA (M78 family)